MRKDLTKVLCERERYRSKDHFTNYRNLRRFNLAQDLDFADEELKYVSTFGINTSGCRESMKFRYGNGGWGGRKDFGEHLNPLYGIVRKNVGRKWDDVYSEFSKSFDRRSQTGQHIWEHLFDQIAEPSLTFFKEGEVWVTGRRFWYGPEQIQDSIYRYYVDPLDGILKKNTGYKNYSQKIAEIRAKKKEEELKTRRVLNKETELLWIKGVWYEVKFQDFNLRKALAPWSYKVGSKVVTIWDWEYPKAFDVLKKGYVTTRRVAVSRRTLSRKELKQHGLVA